MSINFPQVDQEILGRWKEINAFHRQVELSQGRPRYTFSDGPPFGMCLQLDLSFSSAKELTTWCLATGRSTSSALSSATGHDSPDAHIA